MSDPMECFFPCTPPPSLFSFFFFSLCSFETQHAKMHCLTILQICKYSERIKEKFVFLWSSINIISASLLDNGSYCKLRLVGQLETSCLRIMTPWGHILHVRHWGWTIWLQGMWVQREELWFTGQTIILTCSDAEPHGRVRQNNPCFCSNDHLSLRNSPAPAFSFKG